MLGAGKWVRLGSSVVGLATGLAVLVPGVARADGGPLSFAHLLSTPKTVNAQYSCDLSAYKTGIPPVTVSATFTVPGTAQTLVPVPITLTTTSVALPASVLSQLTGVVSFDLAATVTAKQGQTTVSVPLIGHNPVSGTLTGLPAATASDTTPLVFTVPGTPTVQVPAPTLTFTPHTSTTALAAIRCTTTATTQNVSVKVTLGVIGTKGPLYTGVLSAFHIDVEEFLAHIPMTVTASGKLTTGKTATVTLTAGIGGPYTAGTSSVQFSGSLPVTGAQRGKIALSESITDLANPVTTVSGKLRLIKAGTDRVLVPEKFDFTFNAPVSGVVVKFELAFTIKTKNAPVGITLRIAGRHSHPHPSTSPSPTGSPTPTPTSSAGQPQGSGTPSGAPATGGGAGPGGNAVVAVGGLVLVLAGGGLVLLAVRQRRRQRPG